MMCELKPYCDKDCEECAFLKQQIDIQTLCGAVENLKNAILEAFTPLINNAIKVFNKLWDDILHVYPNKKILNLALHHPRERTRKKNMNRIKKWLKKEGVDIG
jgi:hypothetical protein